MGEFKLKKGLHKLKGKIKKLSVFGFDCETHNNNKDLTLMSIYGKDYYKCFYYREDAYKELTSNRIFRNSLICATNLGFDFGALFNDTLDNFKHINIIERNGSIIYARTYIKYDTNDNNFYLKENIKDKSKEFYPITFNDSMNHLKASVENLGNIINLKKLDTPSYILRDKNNKLIWRKPETKKEWEELRIYNKQDSEITYRFMEFIQDSYNKIGCNLKVTISSTALDLFRRSFLNHFWKQENRDKILFQYSGYYGGRTEAFKRGIFNINNYDKINVYDVNSLYPYCLKKFEYPIPVSRYSEKLNTNDIDSFEGITEITLKVPNVDIPLMPYRTDKLLFPTGTIKGIYDFNSLRHALDNGYQIIETGKGLTYEHKFRPFKKYIDVLYKMRKDLQLRKDTTELIPKILMNSFYGKLGFNYSNKETIVHVDSLHKIKDIDKLTIHRYRNSELFRVLTDEESFIPNYVFPIMSLYVTSYARLHMYRLFKKIGFDNMLYTDTDSIFTTKKMNTGSQLGEMKLEKIFEELCIVKPKFYMGQLIYPKEKKQIIKVKGLHKAMKDYKEVKNMVNNNNFKVKTQHFRKMRSALMGKGYINEVYEMPKEMDLNDNKRIWDKKIFTAKPQNSKPISI